MGDVEMLKRISESICLELFREPFAKLASFLNEDSNGRGCPTKRLSQFSSCLRIKEVGLKI